MSCPRWDSNYIPTLENTGNPRRHAESEAVRRLYGLLRGQECAHCPHSFSPELVLRNATFELLSKATRLHQLLIDVAVDPARRTRPDLGVTESRQIREPFHWGDAALVTAGAAPAPFHIDRLVRVKRTFQGNTQQ